MNKLKITLLISLLLILTGCEKYFFFPKNQLFYNDGLVINDYEIDLELLEVAKNAGLNQNTT